MHGSQTSSKSQTEPWPRALIAQLAPRELEENPGRLSLCKVTGTYANKPPLSLAIFELQILVNWCF